MGGFGILYYGVALRIPDPGFICWGFYRNPKHHHQPKPPTDEPPSTNWVFPKIRGVSPKMDGFLHGKTLLIHG